MEDGYILVWDSAAASWTIRKPPLVRGEEGTISSGPISQVTPARLTVPYTAWRPPESGRSVPGRALRPATELGDKRLRKLLADLDSDDFSARNQPARK